MLRRSTEKEEAGFGFDCAAPPWAMEMPLLHLYSINDGFSGTLGNSSALCRQKRSLWTLNTAFTIDCQFPKLDVAGSSPVSRSNKSTTYSR